MAICVLDLEKWCHPSVARWMKEHKKVSATVLNNVNDRFEKRFSNSNFVQCIDRGVGFFEAWVSVFDGVLNWNCRLRTMATAGETECGSAGTQPHEG